MLLKMLFIERKIYTSLDLVAFLSVFLFFINTYLSEKSTLSDYVSMVLLLEKITQVLLYVYKTYATLMELLCKYDSMSDRRKMAST